MRQTRRSLLLTALLSLGLVRGDEVVYVTDMTIYTALVGLSIVVHLREPQTDIEPLLGVVRRLCRFRVCPGADGEQVPGGSDCSPVLRLLAGQQLRRHKLVHRQRRLGELRCHGHARCGFGLHGEPLCWPGVL